MMARRDGSRNELVFRSPAFDRSDFPESKVDPAHEFIWSDPYHVSLEDFDESGPHLHRDERLVV